MKFWLQEGGHRARFCPLSPPSSLCPRMLLEGNNGKESRACELQQACDIFLVPSERGLTAD